MNELGVETRRRSRSKTPFLRSSCDHESCEHILVDAGHVHHKKTTRTATPTVPVIVEETVEVTSSSSIGKETPTKTIQTKIKTSDYSSDDSPEDRIKTAARSLAMETQQHHIQTNFNETKFTKTATATSTTTSTTAIGIKSRKARGSSVATSTPKGNNFLQNFTASFTGHNAKVSPKELQNEIKQNSLNQQKEISAANYSKTRSLSGFLGTSYSDKSINWDDSEHLAYLEYKKVGEYWNKTPKTDYTYSEFSPYRRELAPGIVAMPNMSRRSLENHHERVDYMIEREPSRESYIRKRYANIDYRKQSQTPPLTKQKQENYMRNNNLTYDSGDEVDNQYQAYRKYRPNNSSGFYYWEEKQSWFVRFITAFFDTISSTWSSLANVSTLDSGVELNSYNDSFLYARKRIKKEKGFISYVTWPLAIIFRFISLIISAVLYFDAWLLQSSNPDNRGKKRFLITLLILLPLLLLTGLYYYLHPTETFPPTHFNEFTFTLPELPELLPKIDLGDYINQENLNKLRIQTLDRYDDLKDWTNDYFLYLKTLSQNLYDEGRRLFKSEPYYKRV